MKQMPGVREASGICLSSNEFSLSCSVVPQRPQNQCGHSATAECFQDHHHPLRASIRSPIAHGCINFLGSCPPRRVTWESTKLNRNLQNHAVTDPASEQA